MDTLPTPFTIAVAPQNSLKKGSPTQKDELTPPVQTSTTANQTAPPSATTPPQDSPLRMPENEDDHLSSVLQQGLRNYYETAEQNHSTQTDTPKSSASSPTHPIEQPTAMHATGSHAMPGQPPQTTLVCCPFAPGGALAAKRSWRQRHPVFFWLIILLLVGGLFSLPRIVQHNRLLATTQIGIVNIDGMIMVEKEIINWIETLEKDSAIKGVIVRVNSPGGAVGPSQEIYAAVKQLSRKKKVVVSMGAVAASGGYYIALGGHEIFAGPSTLTGSIGVIMDLPNFEQLMKTVGISYKSLATGPLKGAGSAMREMTPEEEAYFKELLHDMYTEFITTVAEQRNMSLAEVKKVADGRALTGRQALKAGLVDALGGLNDAKTRIRQLCTISEEEPVLYVEGPEHPQALLRDLLKTMLGWQPGSTSSVQTPQFYYQ